MGRQYSYERSPVPDIRRKLLALVPKFVAGVSKLAGVREVALMGSLATHKTQPKDVDLLVTVDDDADLVPLARFARQVSGGAQTHNRGADVFLANPAGHYIGRSCMWKICAPGVRMRCDALHCGLRPHLHDDFDSVRLSDATIANAAVVLWPAIERRCVLPPDVEEMLKELEWYDPDSL
jgi:predicted nucleotidyltransferase